MPYLHGDFQGVAAHQTCTTARQAYFRLRGTLPKNYWLSATRPPAAGAGTNLTFGNFTWPGSTDPLPSNISAEPYTHWAWYYPFTVASKGYDCVYASADLAYDIYLAGDNKDDYTNSLNYLQNDASKNGWNLGTCSIKYYYICEAPSTVFPCYPPPNPPSPPPLPPSPPSPPMPPTCERHCGHAAAALADAFQHAASLCRQNTRPHKHRSAKRAPAPQARRPPTPASSATPAARCATSTLPTPLPSATPLPTARAWAAAWSATPAWQSR